MKIKFIFIILIIFFINNIYAKESKLLPKEEIKKLKNILKDKWTFTEKDNKIIIKSKIKYWFYNSAGLPLMNEYQFEQFLKKEGKKKNYIITLTFESKWSKKKFADAKKYNENIKKQINKLPGKYGIKHLKIEEPNYYYSSKKDEKEKIKKYNEEYNKLYKKIIIIPSCYNADYSILYENNISLYEKVWPDNLIDENILDIFNRVYQ